MESLDKRLLAAILSTAEDSESQENDANIREKSSTHLRPFHWYNYLQQERPVEFSALNELVQKLQTGKLHCKFFCAIMTAIFILFLGQQKAR